MVKAVLFDLGNTLISYYTKSEFPEILHASICNCINYIKSKKGKINENIWENVQEHNHGSPENRVYPLENRLSSIFSIEDPDTITTLCNLFMEPIFDSSRLHDDVVPVLMELKRRGFTIGLISNTPWGSPSRLWKQELERYKLLEYFDDCVFCADVGWRKPDERIFHFALKRLGLEAEECMFVGDDPRWDITGPEAIGMKAVLIDRLGKIDNSIHKLHDVLELVGERRVEDVTSSTRRRR